MTNLFKTMSGAMLFAFVLQTGCGSAPLQVRDPAGTNPADDVLIFQEAMLGLVGASSSAQEAGQRVTAYCEKNSAAIGAAFSAMDRNADENATPEFMDRLESLMVRAEKALGDKTAYMDTESFREAASRCRSLGAFNGDVSDDEIEGTGPVGDDDDE